MLIVIAFFFIKCLQQKKKKEPGSLKVQHDAVKMSDFSKLWPFSACLSNTLWQNRRYLTAFLLWSLSWEKNILEMNQSFLKIWYNILIFEIIITDRKIVVIQTSMFGNFLENEWSEPVTSRKTVTVFVGHDKI
jgi:hypothetical protein